jgi:hypothetical protein
MKFKISRSEEGKFNGGLRGFFSYRDLHIEDASFGDFGANVIKTIADKHSRGDWHYLQMVYILKGWVTFEYKGTVFLLLVREIQYTNLLKFIIERLNTLRILS